MANIHDKNGFWSRRGRLLRYAPLLFFVAFIFAMSSGEASMAKTSLFVRPMLEFLFPNADEATLQFYHAIIRKCAHLAEYGALGFVAARAFRYSRRATLSNRWWLKAAILALLIAATDAFHQSFDPSRTATPYDVLLDLAGAILGVAGYASASKLYSWFTKSSRR